MIEEALSVCLLLLKNVDKARAFRTSRGKTGDFKSPESENDKPLFLLFSKTRIALKHGIMN